MEQEQDGTITSMQILGLRYDVFMKLLSFHLDHIDSVEMKSHIQIAEQANKIVSKLME